MGRDGVEDLLPHARPGLLQQRDDAAVRRGDAGEQGAVVRGEGLAGAVEVGVVDGLDLAHVRMHVQALSLRHDEPPGPVAAGDEVRHAVAVKVGKGGHRAVRLAKVLGRAAGLRQRELAVAREVERADVEPVVQAAPVDPADQVGMAVAVEVAEARVEIVRAVEQLAPRAEPDSVRRAPAAEQVDGARAGAGHDIRRPVAIPVARVEAAVRQDELAPVVRSDAHRRAERTRGAQADAEVAVGVGEEQVGRSVVIPVRHGDGAEAVAGCDHLAAGRHRDARGEFRRRLRSGVAMEPGAATGADEQVRQAVAVPVREHRRHEPRILHGLPARGDIAQLREARRGQPGLR